MVVEFCGIIGFQRILENFGGWKENRVLKIKILCKCGK